MGSYFRRNYRKGGRIEIPDEMGPGKNREWNRWKQRRLGELGFYDESGMRFRDYKKTDEAPPRIHLRGDGDFGQSSLTSDHLEFKVWLQNKVEEAASGKGSSRFLSEQGRESEREKAMEVWEDLTEHLHEMFRDRYIEKSKIENSNFRESRHLMLLRKVSAWDRPDLKIISQDPWAHPDAGELTLNARLMDSLTPMERICREAIRVLIRNSITSEVNSQSFTFVAGMTFIEDLQKRIYDILMELCETARGYTPVDWCGPKGMEFDERKAHKEILDRGFGSLNGPHAKGPPEKVTEHNSVKMAYDITNMLLEEGLLQRQYMTPKEFLDYFYDGDESKENRKLISHLPHKFVFSEYLWERIGEGGPNHPIFRWLRGEQDRWMYCPPVQHRHSSKSPAGGLLTSANRRLVGGREAIFERFDPPTPRCQLSQHVFEALNALQATQWEINLDFLTSLFDIELNDKDRTLLSPGGWLQKEFRIKKIRPKEEFETVFTPTDSKSRDIRTNVLEWARRIIEHNANVFWHSWTCDFRGRMTPRCPRLSPVGDDLDRAMIRFKQWKPLGEDGIFWFRVHVHNMMEGIESELLDKPAAKQRTFKQRSEWVKRNRVGLSKLASDPAKHRSDLELDRYVSGKSEAFQRIAALVELDRVYHEYEANGNNWSEVKSGQPVYLDASCNGYQHLAALLRDRELADKVNLIGSGSPRDLYGVVSANADRSDANILISELLDDDDAAEAVKRVFSRNTAKLPTMTRVYGSTDIEKSLQGRNGRGKPEYSDPVPFEMSEKQQLELATIPETAKQAHLEWRSDPDKEIKFSHFKDHCKDENGKPLSENKVNEWKKLLDGRRSLPLWAEGSGLHVALLRPEDSISEVFREHEYEQPKLTLIVAKSYEVSISTSTVIRTSTGSDHGAFEVLEKPLKRICRLNDALALHPGVTWKLPDGFVVNNYYIKHHQRDKTSGGMPCHLRAAFSPMVPDWYSKDEWNGHKGQKSKARIVVRVNHLYGKDKQVPSNLRTSLGEAVKGKVVFDRRLIEDILAEVDPGHLSDEANEIRKVILHASYSLLRFAKKQEDRIDKRGLRQGLAPNFVHSLDAYHMRTVICELSELIDDMYPEDNFSFWPVHDAFGTHPCDVPTMRQIVTETFAEMYRDKDLRDWLDHMVKESTGIEIDFDKDPLEVNDGPYKGVTVKDSKDGEPGLKTMCSERGLSTSGNKKDRVRRLKELDAEEEGMTVEELYPPLMLKDLWDRSEVTLDISEVADAGYLIS
jgi:hypothetical protein